jgi:tRNA A-37 threonylcarbamoyl transferase component Bud32
VPIATAPDPLHVCPACDLQLGPDAPRCPRCGGKAFEVRVGLDRNVGRVLDGRYQIRAVVGQGGMGTVYRARQHSIGRDVAVKLIHEPYRRDLTWIRRFLREARLASQLHHPHTVGVLDFGQTGEGDLFLVMELLAGRTLAAVSAADGAFDAARTVGLGVQICDALSAAHGRLVVHRDLKPQNIFVLDEPPGRDFVKLLDFGLAKSLGADVAASQTSELIGTPYYMAPELCAEAPSTASDLYAVGVVLCEAHLGRRLFPDGSFEALLQAKASIELPAAIDPRLRDVLRDLLEPHPRRRPQVALDVRARLERCLGAPARTALLSTRAAVTGPASPPTAPLSVATGALQPEVPWRRRRWRALAGLAALAALAGGVIALTLDGDAPVAAGAPCQPRATIRADPNTGRSWSQVWQCENDGGALLYDGPSAATATAFMDTTRSWFVCFRHGDRHAGGNDIWYYTQGDGSLPGWDHRDAWGYMAAVDVHAPAHPVAGMPACPPGLRHVGELAPATSPVPPRWLASSDRCAGLRDRVERR